MKQKSLSFLFIIVFVGTSYAFSIVARAGRYELIEGKGVEVCEQYKKNLESFNEPGPMACERKISPEFKDFEKPVWEKVDLEQHRELFRRLLRYQGPDRDQFRRGYYEDADLDSSIRDHKQRAYPFVSRTEFQLTPYGKGTGDILIYRDGTCPYPASFHATNIYLLTEAPGVQDAMIDAGSPLQKQLHADISPNNGVNTTVDVFRYKGAPYIDRYCLNEGCCTEAKNTLTVFKYGPTRGPKPAYAGDDYTLGFQKICEYHYHDK